MRAIVLFALPFLTLASALPKPAITEEPSQSFSQRWVYPNNSAGGDGESTGKVSYSRSTRRTTDNVENVVLWYAERVGLAKDHALVLSANTGFAKLRKRLDIRTNIGQGTEETPTNLAILGTITSDHAHVTMIYQSSLEEKTDVIISITQTPDGANIHVLRQNTKKVNSKP